MRKLHSPRSRKGNVKVILIVMVPLAVGAFLVFGGSASSSGETADSTSYLSSIVERGDLAVEVTDRGNLESASNVEHRCEVEGRVGGGTSGGTTILWIIEEGTQVKEGELLVELDSSNLEDMEKTQRIAYENALSTYELAKAEKETSEKTIKEHEEGIFIQEEKTNQSLVTVEEENLKRAQELVKHSEMLYRKGFETSEALEAARFAVTSATLNLESAQLALNVFLDVTKDRTLTQLKGELESKRAAMRAEKTKVEQEKERLDKVVTQLGNCKIIAKAEGMVVYYKPARSWGRQEDDIQEGTSVRERQKLIILPDLENMQVRMLVHESKIDWIKAGQPARIRIDAFADQVLTGVVTTVATTPEQGPWYDRDKRNYPVNIKIDEPIEGLKPGMTAETTILVEKMVDVVKVPVNCVRTVGQNSECYVIEPGNPNPEKRLVTLGRSNDVHIQILSGLKEGDRVIQSPEDALNLDEEYVAGETEEESAFSDDEVDSANSSTGTEEGTKEKKKEPSLMDNDKDGDGKISKEEAPDQVLEYFDAMDKNKDGYISRSENAAAVRAYKEQQQKNQQGGAP